MYLSTSVTLLDEATNNDVLVRTGDGTVIVGRCGLEVQKEHIEMLFQTDLILDFEVGNALFS
jgi:hypothetical protein